MRRKYIPHYHSRKRKQFKYEKRKPAVIRWKLAEYERLGGVCPECGSKMHWPDPGGYGNPGLHAVTIDHIIPIDQGGHNEITNYALLCWMCNQNKDLKRKYGARAILVTEENKGMIRGRRHYAESRLYWEHRLDRANLFLRRRVCAFPYIKNVFIHLANNETIDKPLDL